jgi:hypothetical protein
MWTTTTPITRDDVHCLLGTRVLRRAKGPLCHPMYVYSFALSTDSQPSGSMRVSWRDMSHGMAVPVRVRVRFPWIARLHSLIRPSDAATIVATLRSAGAARRRSRAARLPPEIWELVLSFVVVESTACFYPVRQAIHGIVTFDQVKQPFVYNLLEAGRSHVPGTLLRRGEHNSGRHRR